MKTSGIFLLAMLPLLACLAANAQQLNQPNVVAPAKPATSATANPAGTLGQSGSVQSRGVSSDPAQRSQLPAISSKGPAVDASKPVQPTSTQPQAPAKPLHVTDASGRVINGAVQVGPNRVMDPATGRTYSTMPAGEGQRLVEPWVKP